MTSDFFPLNSSNNTSFTPDATLIVEISGTCNIFLIAAIINRVFKWRGNFLGQID